MHDFQLRVEQLDKVHDNDNTSNSIIKDSSLQGLCISLAERARWQTGCIAARNIDITTCHRLQNGGKLLYLRIVDSDAIVHNS